MGPKKQQEPTEVTPTAVPSNTWDRWERILRILQPVMMGILTVLTLWLGQRANAAAVAAQKTADVVAKNDSSKLASLDTIHHLVDGTKSRLDTLVYGLQVENTMLREALLKNGITVPSAPEQPKRKVNP